ncbi:uncharacterized protein IWZ02DRAFT_284189 [Phyllosticta citriasiana]|uniref:Glycosyltransferase family 31 protein n=1 Tax=Phyllosticta citriasiana TaxID=595635 RepID=A0ABR1KZP4_9PEZI
MVLSASRPRISVYLVTAATLLVLIVTWQHLGLLRQNSFGSEQFVPETVRLDQDFGEPPHIDVPSGSQVSRPPPDGNLPCKGLEGADDVFVVLKTGATEAHEKVPIHLDTTLRCIPNYAIFSDLAEEIDGQQIQDALDEYPDEIKTTNGDFAFYRQLHDFKREGRSFAELDEGASYRAWNLDKWKFVPMMERALRQAPTQNWFFFMEADSYVVWSNLLRWVRVFDPDKPFYIGGQNWMMDRLFGHSGSGVLINRAAMEAAMKKRNENVDLWNKLTSEDLAGDLVVASLMEVIGVELTPAFPVLQQETPYSLDYTSSHWCYGVVSYHHMPADWTKAMWDFEQSWLQQGSDPPILRHRDVFANVVAPQISTEKENWDNLSMDFEETPRTYDVQGCREACASRPECVQYLFSPGRCQTGGVIRLGGPGSERDPINMGVDSVSGWVVQRVNGFIRQVETEGEGCKGLAWVGEKGRPVDEQGRGSGMAVTVPGVGADGTETR